MKLKEMNPMYLFVHTKATKIGMHAEHAADMQDVSGCEAEKKTYGRLRTCYLLPATC